MRSGLLTVGCPLCRRVTCIARGQGLQEALWVNSKLWDQIPEEEDIKEEEEEEDGEKQTAAQERTEAKALHGEWWVHHFEYMTVFNCLNENKTSVLNMSFLSYRVI